MKPLAATIIATILMGAAALAQSTPPSKDPPAPATVSTMSDKNKQYLDAYLAAWEKRMLKIDGLETKCVLTEVEDGQKVVRVGEAALLKPNYCKLFLRDQANPNNTKKIRHFVADGKYLWQYDYGKKVVLVEELPKDGIGDNMLMAFLFMTKAADLKKRFDLTIDVDNPERHTDHYLFISILPKSKEDMQDFKKAELVLWKNNKDEKFADRWMLPARLWFQQPNGNQIIWEFQNQSTEKHLAAKDFQAPALPDRDWKREWSRPPAPIVRTSAPPK
ncbi:MAG TPA: TIGR03009 domain-containing protein [Gemmataceae bacterium]|jgi:TIGR03009 family protein|nr:TIGR03009 domain-containing protein [Gemmataceae bacterium]